MGGIRSSIVRPGAAHGTETDMDKAQDAAVLSALRSTVKAAKEAGIPVLFTTNGTSRVMINLPKGIYKQL